MKETLEELIVRIIKEEKNNLTEIIQVDFSKYERSHGKKPKNTRGAWAFEIDGKVHFAPTSLDLKTAIKWAKSEAKALNSNVVYLAP